MKDIPGYENLYAVTSCGKVWSYHKKDFIALNNKKSGYKEALLSKNGVRKHYQVHRLVLMTYNPIEGMENMDVSHLDEDCGNNCLNNLCWMSHIDNCNYGGRNQRISENNGAKRRRLGSEG